jgi:hypothetical protein
VNRIVKFEASFPLVVAKEFFKGSFEGLDEVDNFEWHINIF